MRANPIRSEVAFDRNTSVWARDQPPGNAALKNNLEVDVAVVGGGNTGLSAAYHIKKRFPERSVVVLEAIGVGHGASGRNGGMLLPQPGNEYLMIDNPDTHKLTYDVTVETVKEVTGLMETHGFASGFKFDGSLKTFRNEGQISKSKKYVPKVVDMGMPIEFWDRERVVHELGTTVYHCGIFEPNAAEVNPMLMVHALKQAAESVGVQIYESSPVYAVHPGETLNLTVGQANTAPSQVAAKALVLGTNGYSPINGFLINKIFTLHTEMAATRVVPDSIFDEIGWRNRLTFHDDNTLLYHVGSTVDNRILIGAGNAEYFLGNNPVYQAGLAKRERMLFAELTRLWPKLEITSFEHLWSGVLSAAIDLAPSVGTIGKEKNIYFGAGFAGHGVNFSYLSGKVIGDLYAGDDEQWNRMPFVNRNHFPKPPEPLRWVGIKSYLAFLRVGDYFK